MADGTTEAGFRVFLAGGLGANPHPAQALEEFTSREDLLATIEATLRTFDHSGNRDNKLRARIKWLVDTMGIDELRERIVKERNSSAPRPPSRAACPTRWWPTATHRPAWAPRSSPTAACRSSSPGSTRTASGSSRTWCAAGQRHRVGVRVLQAR